MQKLLTKLNGPKMLLSILLSISLMSCARSTTETVRSVSNACLIFSGISFSEPHGADVESVANKYDTPATVAQIKQHDLKYESTCPQPTPATPE